MTLNIEISGKYRLTSDAMQIVIQRKHTVDPTKAPGFNPHKLGEVSVRKREEWRDWKYCGSPAQAIDIIASQQVFDSDATSLQELRCEITSFRQEISDFMA